MPQVTKPAPLHMTFGIKASTEDERGAVAVEFALILSVLILILFGIFEFGREFSRIQVLNGAAREGARLAAVQGTDSQVRARVVDAAEPYSVDPDSIGISPLCTSSNTGSEVTVSWNQPIEIAIPLMPVFNRTPLISATFRCE